MATNIIIDHDEHSLVATFPASWLRLLRGERRTLDEVFADVPGCRFAVNGPMFESRIGSDVFLLRDVEAGVDVPSRVLDEGATIWVANGRAVGAYGGGAPADARVAIQGWPSLVVDGNVTATNVGTNAEHDDRAGVGATDDGRVVVVVMRGTMVALGNRMQAARAKVAAYLDGGSSLQAGGEGVRVESSRVAPVPAWVLAAPSASTGATPWLVGGAIVAALAYAAWPKKDAA